MLNVSVNLVRLTLDRAGDYCGVLGKKRGASLTTDRNLRYQQNLAGRKIAVIIFSRQQWPQLQPHVQRVVDAINVAVTGSYLEIEIPA